MVSQSRLGIIGIILGILALMSVFLVACGSPASTPSTPTSPLPSPTPILAPPRADETTLRLKGEEIFQKTAGGIGCQSCHGADGKGGNLGPDIRGKAAEDVKGALGGDAMSFIQLSEEDIQAVAAYLKYLASPP